MIEMEWNHFEKKHGPELNYLVAQLSGTFYLMVTFDEMVRYREKVVEELQKIFGSFPVTVHDDIARKKEIRRGFHRIGLKLFLGINKILSPSHSYRIANIRKHIYDQMCDFNVKYNFDHKLSPKDREQLGVYLLDHMWKKNDGKC